MGCWIGYGRTRTRTVRRAEGDETIKAFPMAEEDDPSDRFLVLRDSSGGEVKLRRAHLDWLMREIPAMRDEVYRGPVPKEPPNARK